MSSDKLVGFIRNERLYFNYEHNLYIFIYIFTKDVMIYISLYLVML